MSKDTSYRNRTDARDRITKLAMHPELLGPSITPRPVLISYVYLDGFLKSREKHAFKYRDYVLDSGAFSAHNKGEKIDLDDFIQVSKNLLATDPTLTEVFALDVIGDWRASIRNCEKMWAAGVPAIPCYHVGEPEDVLRGIARDYPKIALGGLVGKPKTIKQRFIDQCFARVWPKAIHGFGLGTESSVLGWPFHSTDATNWFFRVSRFGLWRTLGDDQRLTVRDTSVNIACEIEWYQRLEERARSYWKKEMALIGKTGPNVRLAMAAMSRSRGMDRAFGCSVGESKGK